MMRRSLVRLAHLVLLFCTAGVCAEPDPRLRPGAGFFIEFPQVDKTAYGTPARPGVLLPAEHHLDRKLLLIALHDGTAAAPGDTADRTPANEQTDVEPPRHAELRKSYDKQAAHIASQEEKKLKSLGDQYLAAVKAAESKARYAGKLYAVLAIKEYRTVLADSPVLVAPTNAIAEEALFDLIEQYRNGKRAILGESGRRRHKLDTAYLGRMESLVRALTKAGQIQEASYVHAEKVEFLGDKDTRVAEKPGDTAAPRAHRPVQRFGKPKLLSKDGSYEVPACIPDCSPPLPSLLTGEGRLHPSRQAAFNTPNMENPHVVVDLKRTKLVARIEIINASTRNLLLGDLAAWFSQSKTFAAKPNWHAAPDPSPDTSPGRRLSIDVSHSPIKARYIKIGLDGVTGNIGFRSLQVYGWE